MNYLSYLLSLSQADLKKHLYEKLKSQSHNTINGDGFLYQEGEIPILLVAHMDTVFKEQPKNIYYDRNLDKIFSYEGGIGGDDRCGIYAIMEILKDYKPHVLFTEDEEKGCVGAIKAVNQLVKPNIKYIIEFDRKGSVDCVFYECNNNKFQNYVESFGFKTNYGSFSDISVLGIEWNIAAVNLSCGYYNEHTCNEYIIFNELLNSIEKAKEMLNQHINCPYYKYNNATQDMNNKQYKKRHIGDNNGNK